jgi:hypothetical protein
LKPGVGGLQVEWVIWDDVLQESHGNEQWAADIWAARCFSLETKEVWSDGRRDFKTFAETVVDLRWGDNYSVAQCVAYWASYGNVVGEQLVDAVWSQRRRDALMPAVLSRLEEQAASVE